MNIALRFKDVLRGLSPALTDELDQLVQRINVVWKKGHDPQTGTHKTLQFDSTVVTQTTVGPAGTAAALPANPLGYLPATLADGTAIVIPYYPAS